MKKITISTLLVAAVCGYFPSLVQAQEIEDYIHLITKKSGVLYVDGATRIDIIKARELHEEAILFIDVNSPRGYAAAHIPSAVSLDIKTMLNKESLAEHATQDQMLVFYCPHIACWGAAHAAAKSILWGYTNVYIFDGGAKSWIEAGLPVDKG